MAVKWIIADGNSFYRRYINLEKSKLCEIDEATQFNSFDEAAHQCKEGQYLEYIQVSDVEPPHSIGSIFCHGTKWHLCVEIVHTESLENGSSVFCKYERFSSLERAEERLQGFKAN